MHNLNLQLVLLKERYILKQKLQIRDNVNTSG